MLIRHDTRYKLAALTAELWGRGCDADGAEEGRRCQHRWPRLRGSRVPQMRTAPVVFSAVFHQVAAPGRGDVDGSQVILGLATSLVA